jgi:hypothetical protein
MLFSYSSFAASLLLTFLVAESDRDVPRPMLLFYFSFNFHATYTLPYFYFTSHLVVKFLCAPRAAANVFLLAFPFSKHTSRAIVCIVGEVECTCGRARHMTAAGGWVGGWVSVALSPQPRSKISARSEKARTHTRIPDRLIWTIFQLNSFWLRCGFKTEIFDAYVWHKFETRLKNSFQQYLLEVSGNCQILIHGKKDFWWKYLNKKLSNSLELGKLRLCELTEFLYLDLLHG